MFDRLGINDFLVLFPNMKQAIEGRPFSTKAYHFDAFGPAF
jgi:hypothetical protein